MSLHNEIMNAEPPKGRVEQYEHQSGHSAAIYYKLGHRDARHVAAELALQAEAELERTRDHLLKSIDRANELARGLFAAREERDALRAAMEEFLETQDALDNHELMGPNAEDYFVLLRRRNAARKDLDAAIASA